MNKTRLEAFSDAILAIIMTIMILEIKTPKTFTMSALLGSWKMIASYLISFFGLASLWYYHQTFFNEAKTIDINAFWVNMCLLVWVSFVPLTTSWVAEFANERLPEFTYLFVQVGWYGLAFLLSKSLHINSEQVSINFISRSFSF